MATDATTAALSSSSVILSIFPPDAPDATTPDFPSVMAAVGRGLPLWQSLHSKQDLMGKACEPGSNTGALAHQNSIDVLEEEDQDARFTQRSLRLVCRSINHLSYDLVTQLSALHLGSDLDSSGYESGGDGYVDEPACWPPSQQLHQQQVRQFVQRLGYLISVKARVHPGGLSQLSQLLEQGSLGQGIRRLEVHEE